MIINQIPPHFRRMSIVTTLKCNLKCEYCRLYIPLLARPIEPDFNDLCRQIDKIFSLFTLDIFEFVGAEVLLRRDFPELLRYTNKYINNSSEFRFITNGTILPSNQLLDVMSEYNEKFLVIIDEYESSTKVKEVETLFKEKSGVRTRINYYNSKNAYGGWVNYNNTKIKKNTEMQAADIHSRCHDFILKPFPVLNGKAAICCGVTSMLLLYGSDGFADDFVDIMDESKSLEQIREEIYAQEKRKYLTGCFYCNGCTDESKRYSAGRQLNKNELKRYKQEYEQD